MRFAAVSLLAVAGCLFVPGRAAALPAGAPPTGMVCTPGAVAGPNHTFDLTAQTGYIDTPDGNSVFMWSYAEVGGHFQSPGPVLCVTQGQTVVVNLTNNLPEPVSIVFPGQDAAVNAAGGSAGLLTTEAAANGGTVQYSFVAGLVPPPEIAANDKCTQGVAKVETERSFLNALVGAVTYNIFTPMHTKVTCAGGPIPR